MNTGGEQETAMNALWEPIPRLQAALGGRMEHFRTIPRGHLRGRFQTSPGRFPCHFQEPPPGRPAPIQGGVANSNRKGQDKPTISS